MDCFSQNHPNPTGGSNALIFTVVYPQILRRRPFLFVEIVGEDSEALIANLLAFQSTDQYLNMNAIQRENISDWIVEIKGIINNRK